MAKILSTILPQPPREYRQGAFNQLIRTLQRILGIEIQTPDDVDETEAINFFIGN